MTSGPVAKTRPLVEGSAPVLLRLILWAVECLSLDSGNSNDANDVLPEAATRQVVYGTREALQQRSIGFGLSETLG